MHTAWLHNKIVVIIVYRKIIISGEKETIRKEEKKNLKRDKSLWSMKSNVLIRKTICILIVSLKCLYIRFQKEKNYRNKNACKRNKAKNKRNKKRLKSRSNTYDVLYFDILLLLCPKAINKYDYCIKTQIICVCYLNCNFSSSRWLLGNQMNLMISTITM